MACEEVHLQPLAVSKRMARVGAARPHEVAFVGLCRTLVEIAVGGVDGSRCQEALTGKGPSRAIRRDL